MKASPSPRPDLFPPEMTTDHIAAVGKTGSEITRPQQRILTALEWWRSLGVTTPTRDQVGVLSNYTVSGGTFGNRVSELRAMGLVEYPADNVLQLTPAGEAAAGALSPPRSLDELRRRVDEILTVPQRKIFKVILDGHGKELPRTHIAEMSGYEVTGGTFGNRVSELRTLGLVVYPKKTTVAAAPLVTTW